MKQRREGCHFMRPPTTIVCATTRRAMRRLCHLPSSPTTCVPTRCRVCLDHAEHGARRARPPAGHSRRLAPIVYRLSSIVETQIEGV